MYRFFLAIRYLRSRLVNLISIGGVAAGVAVLIVVVAIMDGFQARVRKHVRGSLAHISMSPKTAPEDLPRFTEIEEELRQTIPHVVAGAPQIGLPVFFEYKTDRVTILGNAGSDWHQMEAIGIAWEYEKEISDLRENLLAPTREDDPFFNQAAADREKTTALVSRTFAENFMLGAYDEDGNLVHRYGALRDDHHGLPLEGADLEAGCAQLIGTELRVMWGAAESDGAGGRDIKTNSKNLIISGVFDAHDAVEDNRKVYLPLVAIRKMSRVAHEYLQLRLRLDDYEHAPLVKNILTERYRGQFTVETWEDQKQDFLRAVNNEKVLLVIVLSFIILLGGFIILATLTLTVVEKTRDIGIVAALGAARRGVLSIFLWTGLLIGILGALLGLGLGYWFTANVNWVKDRLADLGVNIFPPKIYHFREIPTVWDWASVLTIMGGAVGVAFFAGLLPALRAARMDPIKALRHE